MSGKIIAASFFGVAILAFGVWQWLQKDSAEPLQSKNDAQQPSALIDDTDTDGDGLKDWEELLLGLNPNNPDSDADGISDKEELAQARSAPTTQEAGVDTDQQTQEFAQTDVLAREIFGAYIQSKQLGTYDPSAFENIIAQSTQGTFTINNIAAYTLDDIKTTNDTSASTTSSYESAFQEAILAVTDISEYELTTYGRAVETGNEEDFEKLLVARDVYLSIAEELLSITVPEDGAVAHLDLINAFTSFANTLEHMAQSPDDPIVAFVSMRNFIEREDAIKTAYAQIDIYFTLKETQFGV